MICIWSSWCHCHLIISWFSKIQNGLPFCSDAGLPRLSWAYPGCPGPLNVFSVVVVNVLCNVWIIILLYCFVVFFRITDGTQKIQTVCANFSHTRSVHEVLNDLEVKFELACVPEPKESSQYILAHATGHKTVSLSVFRNAHVHCTCVHLYMIMQCTQLQNYAIMTMAMMDVWCVAIVMSDL